ncbi:MAG: ATP-binding protein [Firmicutes bacterium]|nr:ATP-binding protein [Bacillota bacterium]
MIRKIFLTFFSVQLITYVTTIIGNIIDGIVTGSFLGTSALAAYGLATPFLTVITAIASAMSVGTSTLLSSKLGKGEMDEMKRAFRVCFWTILIVSTAIAAGIILLANPIATALKAEGEVHGMAVEYMRAYAIGIPPIFLVVLAMPVLQIIGKRPFLIASIVTLSGVNILLDFVNVLLVHGGMFGMALATTISFYVALVLILATIQSKSSMLSIGPERLDASMIREMAVYGAPNAVSMGCRNILTMVLNILILAIAGMHMVAVYAAISSAMNMAMAIGSGMAAAVSVLTGIFAAEKDKQDLITLIKLSVVYSVIFNAICIIVFIIFSGGVVSLFLKDKSLLPDAELGLKIAVFITILYSINFCLRSYYQAMKMPITIPYAIVNGLVATALIAFALGKTVGIIGVWISLPLGELVSLIIFGTIALVKNRRAKGRGLIERVMMIPEEYDDEIGPLEMKVASMEDAVQASEKTRLYMKEKGASDRISIYAALAVEEMAGNIIRHGFDDGRSHHVDVKLKKDGERWILRFRDDCRNFDPVAYVESITPEEKESHYGIRMIYGLADDVRYLNTLKLNNLIISFRQEEQKQ